MNKQASNSVRLHSSYIARLHAAHSNHSIVWGLISAVWFHLGASVVLMNTSISTFEAFKPYESEEPLIMVQRLLQTGMEPGGFIERSRLEKSNRPEEKAAPAKAESIEEVAAPPEAKPSIAPEPPAPIEEASDEPLHFVRVDEPSEIAPDPANRRIAKHNARAREERRTQILSETLGPMAPHYDEMAASRDDGQAGLDEPSQADAARMGALKAETPGERRVRSGKNGDTLGAAVSGNTRGSAGEAAGLEGLEGSVRAQRQIQASGASAAGEKQSPTAGAYAMDPDNTHVTRRKAPTSWSPSFFRYQGSQRHGEADNRSPTAPSPRVDDPPSPAPKNDLGHTKGRKKTGKQAQSGGEPVEEIEIAPEPQPTREEFTIDVRALGPDELDPVAKLQEDLGWGGVVTRPTDVRRGTVGLVGSDGSKSASPQTVLSEDFPLANDVAVSALGTELGAYLHEVDLRIAKGWNEADLLMEDRALGIQGRVTLTIQIRASGKVARVDLTASSGNPRLDEMAKQAIPRRFKGFPRELDIQGIAHRLTLRYSNPLIMPGPD
jgi:TonB family protein